MNKEWPLSDLNKSEEDVSEWADRIANRIRSDIIAVLCCLMDEADERAGRIQAKRESDETFMN